MSDKSYPTGGEFLLREYDPQNVFTPEDFDETQRMFAQTVEDFCEKVIGPRVEELEYEGNAALGQELLKEAGQMGLLMADIPEASATPSCAPSSRHIFSTNSSTPGLL